MHMRIDFDLLSERGRRGVPGVRRAGDATWSSRSAARSPASTATDGRGRSCCGRMYGADGLALLAEMKRASGIRPG